MNSLPNRQPTEELLRRVSELHAAGKAVLVSSPQVQDTLAILTDDPTARRSNERQIVLAWEHLPVISDVLEQTLDQLALAAKAFWPDWYSTVVPVEPNAGETLENLRERVAELGLERQVLDGWLRSADTACRSDNLPRRQEFTPQVELRQLVLALGGRACSLVLATEDAEPSSTALNGLARAVEFFVQHTSLPIMLVVPDSLAARPEFDNINFDCLAAPEFLPDAGEDAAGEIERDCAPAKVLPTTGSSSPSQREAIPQSFVFPLIGKPHPNSRGEQLLWKRLQADAELAGLFQPNQWAATQSQSHYLVDFICRSAKFIVEVDGYYWHRSQAAFSRDRHRDYEFQRIGYRVLRLPHDEVLADLEAAITKIRNVIRICTKESEENR